MRPRKAEPLRGRFFYRNRAGRRFPQGLAPLCKGNPPSPWLPLTRELSPQATEGENLQSVCSEARRECGIGIVPRLRARRTASTFHRRKVDRKAAGGPLHQGRNAPRSPPFALSEDGFCCTPAPRLPRGLASPSGDEGRERPYTFSPTVPSLAPCLHRRTAPSRASGPSSWRPMGNWVSCRRSSS